MLDHSFVGVDESGRIRKRGFLVGGTKSRIESRRLRFTHDAQILFVFSSKRESASATNHRRGGGDMDGSDGEAWLPDGNSQIFRSHVLGPSGFWTMAPLRYAAKFDPFLSLDCAPRPPPWRNTRKGRGQILQRSVAEP